MTIKNRISHWRLSVTQSDLAQRVEAVRRFNRFYTQQIGVLTEEYLKSPFSLTESRVIYELAHHEETSATLLVKELGLDAGYLSRILRRFKKRGLITKQPSETDRRLSVLRLSARGQEAFAFLNSHSQRDIEAMLNTLRVEEQKRLIAAMDTIQRTIGLETRPKAPFILRPHQPGDMGWVVHRHGVLYAEEYGWDEHFEALVAGIVAKFIRHYEPARERCWIAEREGENVGSVFLVKKSKQVAKLRLLLVDPKARGLGIGSRLVSGCLRFARQAGYRKITLWTNSVLTAARHIYEQAGFILVDRQSHHSFGHDLVAETWERML
jgi:DNA-binding MarR family transcriptional regulator/N-acetylglutamate synthase-like GNAT family acetyltransferase